jgi:protein-tyrosine phosphatase
MMPPHTLFICTGNTGRSVAAEALARQWIAARGLAWTVSSRGVAVDPANTRPEAHVVALLAARGIDVAGHRARLVTETDLQAADQVLTMTAAHKQNLQDRFSAADHIRMLSEAAGGVPEDVPDAFGGSLAVYQAMLAQLDALLGATLARFTP